MHTIIGLSGTNGSGKDTLGEILAKDYNFLFISVTDLLRNGLRERGQEVTRENLRALSAEWRREYGLGVLVDRAMAEYEKVKDKYAGVVMASLRNSGESERLHEMDGTLIWLDADPHVRYARIQANAHLRGRGGEDDKSFEEFMAEQEVEMHTPPEGDAANLNMHAVKEQADIYMDNDSQDIEDFATMVGDKLQLTRVN
jgi:cytidylate kinase